MIKINNLNFKYQNGKGVTDINFDVAAGEVVGFIGPNGAGKTTTIRCILGFLKAQSGEVLVDDKNAFTHATEIASKLGYIAGEVAFPDGMTGVEYLRFLREVRARGDKEISAKIMERMLELEKYFELDPTGRIKRMSKGTKQKTAIVAAFMHDPSTYILDEPTSGLDVLMQKKFVDLLLEEKAKGKTILMSSHQFPEIERTCDKAVIIMNGKLVGKVDNVKTIKQDELEKKFFKLHAEGQPPPPENSSQEAIKPPVKSQKQPHGGAK